jgi:hypothetical protein
LTSKCDSIITKQNETIELKDDVIVILREDVKKNKNKTKLAGIIGGLGILTLLIIK